MVMPSGNWKEGGPLVTKPFATRVIASLSRFCQGKTPLARAFWGYYFFGGMVLKGGAVIPAMVAGHSPQTNSLALAMMVSYIVFATIGVWRCADSYLLTLWWSNLAKLATMFFPIGRLCQIFVLHHRQS